MNLRRLWEPLDGIEATLSEHNEAAAFARFAWFALALIILMFLLSGCDRMAMLVKPEPYNAQISPECNLPCDAPMDLPDGDGNTLLAVSKVNRAYLARCSVRHEACQQALDRLKSARVIQ